MINSTCLSKRSYDSKEEAIDEIHIINVNRCDEGMPRISLKVYKCPACSKFHLSKSSKG